MIFIDVSQNGQNVPLGTFPNGHFVQKETSPMDPDGHRKEECSMKKKVEKKQKYDKGQIFVKVMAGFLALLMLVGTISTLIFALI